jgi:TetR/AcrR family transcriptional regulator, transcriptional repressor for nem operon
VETGVKNSTRDRLVEAARTLFWKQGYTSTGIAQILKAADANSGSLYYSFPTKEDLLLAVLEWYRENLWPAVIQPVFDRVSDPIERVFGVLDAYRQGLLMTNFRHGCPIGNLALELVDNHPAVCQLVTVNFTGWRKAIEQCLDEAAGRLPESVDREQLAIFVLTTMEGAVMLARSYQSIDPYDASVTQLRDYFDRLIQDGTDWSAPRPAQPESQTSPTSRTKPRSKAKPKPKSKPSSSSEQRGQHVNF